MIARDAFRPRQRVRLSRVGVARVITYRTHNGKERATTGMVVGFGRLETTIRVLRDGLASIATYPAEYWEPEAH